MVIRSLRFQGFGRFNRGLSLAFDDGLNVILGPNESGKSTIVEGLIGILFGLADRDVEAARRPRRPHEAYAGEVELSTPSGDHRIARDFDTHRVLITRRSGREEIILYQGEANPRGRTDDLLACLSVIEEITGLKDREMAVKTLFMGQGELETAVDERVRHLLSGTRRGDYDGVVQRLEDRYFALTRENPWGRRKKGARELEELNIRIIDLDRRREAALEALRAGERLAADLDRARTALQEIRSESAAKDALLENYTQFFEINRDRSDLEKRLATIRDDKEKVKGIVAEIGRIEAQLWPRFDYFRQAGPEIGENLRSLAVLHRDVALLEEDLKRREAELEGTPWPRNFRLGLIGGGITMVGTFAAFAGAGAALLGVALGLAFGIAAFTAIYLRGKGKERLRLRLEAQVVELSDRLDAQKLEHVALEASMKEVLSNRRIKDVSEEYREYSEKSDLLSRYEQIRDSHRSLTDLEADYDDVFQKLRIIDSRARDLVAKAPYLAGADENLEQVAQGLERVRKDREDVRARALEMEEALETLRLRQARFEGAASEGVEGLDEELAECRQAKTIVEADRDATAVALEVLRESIATFQESHVERLAARTGDFLSRITDGRYGRVSLDRNYTPSVTAESGEEFSAWELSQGARDQLHLALRLAITGDLQGDNPAPMILDDVLVNCDAERLATIKGVLAGLAGEGRQILIFAHDARYREWGHVARELEAAPEIVSLATTPPAA
jgi:uncharacterized protein YhaN